MHFVSIHMNEITKSWRGDLISEVMAIVHQFAAAHVIAAFPQMVAGEAATLGSEMRLFGEPDALYHLMARESFRAITQPILRLGGTISTVLAAPQTDEYRVYVRDRKADHYSPSRYRRAARMGRKMPALDEAMRNAESLPYFRTPSVSTGQTRMVIFVRQEKVERPSGTGRFGNSYGLSSKEQRVAVPHF